MNPEPALDILKESLLLASREESGAFRLDPETFFHTWLRQEGTSSYFLFKKNLDVTDIQLAELTALIRTNAAVNPAGRGPSTTLHVRSTDDFLDLILTAARATAGMSRRIGAATIVDLFGELLRRTIVLDSYWSSATLLTPPGILVDIESVTAQSGYVHSAGDLVWVRNLDKAIPADFKKQLTDHLAMKPVEAGYRRYFCVFAHEDFTEFDRELSAELRDGLDSVKLWVDKFYMGHQRLAEVLADVRTDFPQLLVPPPGDFRTTHREARKGLNLEPHRGIWLVLDRRAVQSGGRWLPSEDRYLICYDQVISNDNPFHLFDENKPAWQAHTTLPHTLASAMINVATPQLRKDPRILDPFVGTGTTLFEASRIPGADLVGLDLEGVSPLLISDNASFFLLSADELEELRFLLAEVSRSLTEGQFSELSHGQREILERFTSQDDSARRPPVIDDDTLIWLPSISFHSRVLFYLCLKASVRNAGGLVRGGMGRANAAWVSAFSGEVAAFIAQLGRLATLRKAGLAEEFPGYTRQEGRYSLSATASVDALTARLGGIRATVADAVDSASYDGTFDLIVTDPPYGFNTEEDWPHLAHTYIEWLRNAVSHLASPGQIVMCLPDRSRIGREPPGFASAPFVLQILNVVASDAGRTLYGPHTVDSGQLGAYAGRYYWESERALRRAIVHVHVS